MAILIDEKKPIDDNLFEYENRIKHNPMIRYLETTPVYTTYYHIDVDETTSDAGFIDVKSILGHNSPIRFNKIENFPLYGMEQIVLQLQQDDQGIDSTFDSQAIILPGTVRPTPNDFFLIPSLRDDFVFRVTNINYDTVMPDNLYRIDFMLEMIDSVAIENMDKQVLDEYTCVLENIGTDTNCIIEKSYFTELKQVQALYDDIASTYFSIYYNDKHNCFLGEYGPNQYVYDVLQTEFINMHKLFTKKSDLKALYLTTQYSDTRRRLKYEKSIYRFVERRNLNLINNFKFVLYQGITQQESSFYRWHDKKVYIMDMPANDNVSGVEDLLSNEFINCVKLNGPQQHKWADLLQRYLRGEELGLKDVDLELNSEILQLDNNIEVFIFTPIILYIIKKIMNDAVSQSSI